MNTPMLPCVSRMLHKNWNSGYLPLKGCLIMLPMHCKDLVLFTSCSRLCQTDPTPQALLFLWEVLHVWQEYNSWVCSQYSEFESRMTLLREDHLIHDTFICLCLSSAISDPQRRIGKNMDFHSARQQSASLPFLFPTSTTMQASVTAAYSLSTLLTTASTQNQRKSSARRREPRRHTLTSGIDYTMVCSTFLILVKALKL